jgi:threonylcarbamoyladenosine tRNA methylthiotransferase MtaB
MPQVARDVVKERARRLRDKGAEALKCHLDREVGARRKVLVETHEMGRTEYFTPVRLQAVEAEAGTILEVRMAGHDGRSLLAA